jgi:superfamily II DNA or RNA helicase
MVQTLAREANLDPLPAQDVLVIDEAHHTAAESYQKIIRHLRALQPEMKILGVTATPNRGDRKGLVGTFDNVADQITLAELIATGVLVRPRTFVVDIGVQGELREVRRTASDFDMGEVARIMDKRVLNDQIVQHWREKAGNRQTVVFCSTVEHAGHVREAFAGAGVSVAMVDGKTASGERAAMLAAFDRGVYQVMVNVAVLTEGWDNQGVSCIVLLRPSSYKSTMIQMIGRGLRRLDPERYPRHPPKNDCIVLDFGTSVLQHGSLETGIDLDPKKRDAPQKECPSCGATIPNVSQECPICGHVFDAVLGVGGSADAGEKDPLGDFVMTEVELLAQSPFKWEELWDGIVMVACAFDAWAALVQYGGAWHAIGGQREHGIRHLVQGERMLCLAAADDWMREHGDADAARKSKAWLHMPATDKQMAYLRGLSGLTRYQAACRMTWKFAERGIRAKLDEAAAGRMAA